MLVEVLILKFGIDEQRQEILKKIDLVDKQICAAFGDHAHIIFPEKHGQQDKIRFAEVIGFKGDGGFRIVLTEPFDFIKADHPHIKSIAPSQLANDFLKGADFLIAMFYKREQPFHLIVQLFLHIGVHCSADLCPPFNLKRGDMPEQGLGHKVERLSVIAHFTIWHFFE